MPEPVQTTPQSSANAFRAVVNGVSLLLLVAMTLQMGAGAIDPAVASGRLIHPDREVARGIAEDLVRRVERVARRQSEQPVAVEARPAVSRGIGVARDPIAARVVFLDGPRRLSPLVTSLPPPLV